MASCLVVRLLISAAIVFLSRMVQAQNEFSVLPENITARISFPARFDCQTNRTNWFIRWSVGPNNEMISEINCPGCNQTTNSSLYIPTVTRAHGGRYTCFIVGGTTTPRASVYLTVAEEPIITSNSATMITINQDEMLEINVNVTGVPQPDITWRRGSEVLNNNPRFTITDSNLRLPNAQYTDAGEYSITAQNIANTVRTSYDVIVLFAPVIAIMRDPDSDMVRENTMVTVTCLVTSNPPSTISWEQITASDSTDKTDRATTSVLTNNQFNTTSSSTLSFTNDDINGFSKFCCIASNDIGTAMRCLNFTETGTPPVPTEFRVIDNTSSTATVAWASLTTDADVMYKLSWSSNGILVNSTLLPSTTMSYTIEGLDGDTVYMLTINAINTRGGQQSFPASITVRTLVAVPGEVDFDVEVLGMMMIFRLTWEAPQGSQISYYIIYTRTMDNMTSQEVPSTNMSYDFPIYQENVIYEFAIQAANEGGRGPISNFMAVLHCSTDTLLDVMYQRFSHSVSVFWNLTSKFDSNEIYLIVREKPGVEFIASIPGDMSSSCIDNLNPNTAYSLTVWATFNCYNVSKSVDFKTLDVDSSDDSVPSQDCIKYDPPQERNGESEGESDSGLEAWAIALIVMIPIIALVVMLSIGIFCALRMRSFPKDHGGLPDDNNAATYRRQQEHQPYQHQLHEQQYHQQQFLAAQHQHFSQQQLLTQPFSPRNNSTSSYPNGSTSDYRSGSTSPTRSAVSSNGRPVWSQPYPPMDEHTPATQV